MVTNGCSSPGSKVEGDALMRARSSVCVRVHEEVTLSVGLTSILDRGQVALYKLGGRGGCSKRMEHELLLYTSTNFIKNNQKILYF